MAAYAALVSLSHILNQILHPPPLNKIIIPREEIEFLRRKVDSLIDFLETYPSRRSQEIADLELKITDSAYEAEDIIESNVIEQIRATGGEKISPLLCEGIQPVLEEFLCIEKELMKMKVIQGVGDLQPKIFTTATSSRPLPDGKITMVGLDKHVNEIMGALASNESNRQIIPIVGMGGIGKTALATAVYNNPFIVQHFHIRAWVTVSQEYTVRQLLLRLLYEIKKVGPNYKEVTDNELGLQLHQELFGRKYLIVLDDMWNIHAWEKLKMFLPHNENGSRILVTTRLSNLTVDLESCTPYKMDFLDEGQSWELLRKKIYAEEDCPVELEKNELEEIGKDIAKRCNGLPLALVVIGGFLAKSERAREHWESIAGNVTSALNCGKDEHLMKILSLSYINLPPYLKSSFLYLAVFPEDFEIPVSMLVRLWVAEGLIKCTQGKCLEEVAHEYLEDLIGRNLILVHKRGSSGKVKRCKIHDLLRDLCIIQAEKEKLLFIAKVDNRNISQNTGTKRRLSISPSRDPVEIMAIEAFRSATFNRSWLSHSELFESLWWVPKGSVGGLPKEWTVSKIIHGFRLLKVVHVNDPETRIKILNLSNLRYVFATSLSSISSMSLCWNLQTLVVDEEDIITDLPAEIWQMPQLRHLKMEGISLPDPPDDQNVIVLENLQTFKVIKNFKCTEQVLERIPNLKKLRISYEIAACGEVGNYCLKNLVCFKKLESLGMKGAEKLWRDIVFPISLKKLTLQNFKIPWEDLSIVGSLPNLEVLKLIADATKGEEWKPVEGEFCRLKFLSIWWCELKIWGAESYHFPCLEHLDLGFVHLEEIPMSFAEILTLEGIQLAAVYDSAWTSAREISDERELLGYEPLQLRRI